MSLEDQSYNRIEISVIIWVRAWRVLGGACSEAVRRKHAGGQCGISLSLALAVSLWGDLSLSLSGELWGEASLPCTILYPHTSPSSASCQGGLA